MKARLNKGYWFLNIVSAGLPPGESVKLAVPGITANDFYWTPHPEGVTIAFRKLKDAETFVAKGGHMLVAFEVGSPDEA